MPAEISKIERVTKVYVNGIVENEPDVPKQYSTVPGRKFRPVQWSVTYVSVNSGPWDVESFRVSGPMILKDGRLSPTQGNWRSSSFRGRLDPEEIQMFPWLPDLIERTRPKTG